MGTVGTKILKYKEGELYYHDNNYYWYYKGNKTSCGCERKLYTNEIIKEVIISHDGDQFLMPWSGFDITYNIALNIHYKGNKISSKADLGFTLIPFKQLYTFRFVPSDIALYNIHFTISTLAIPVIEIPINFIDSFSDRVNLNIAYWHKVRD